MFLYVFLHFICLIFLTISLCRYRQNKHPAGFGSATLPDTGVLFRVRPVRMPAIKLWMLFPAGFEPASPWGACPTEPREKTGLAGFEPADCGIQFLFCFFAGFIPPRIFYAFSMASCRSARLYCTSLARTFITICHLLLILFRIFCVSDIRPHSLSHSLFWVNAISG